MRSKLVLGAILALVLAFTSVSLAFASGDKATSTATRSASFT
jgi:hypothetical protein